MMPPQAADPSRRPRDLALLMLAVGAESPRERARSQKADRAGAALRRKVLDRLAALDPDPQDCEATLARIVAEFDEPSGPARSLSLQFLQEWEACRRAPNSWAWLLAEALER
ncbi:MAG TPA: hypothetical protein VF590_17870 [Isosphaeraceae bacterium]|jgi:hypothetical protein